MIPEEIWQVALAMAKYEGDSDGEAFAGETTERIWLERAAVAVQTIKDLEWKALE